MAPKPPAIDVANNGPYLVRGEVPLSLESITEVDGGSWTYTHHRAFDVKASYALCRCGESGNKPFCDGSHLAVRFDGTETASRAPFAEQARTITGPTLALDDAEALCAYARFCDNAGGIWNIIESDSPSSHATAIHEATYCPSGRLVVRHIAEAMNAEPPHTMSLVLLEDPAEDASGPLFVRGGIPVVSADGSAYEVRNRQTLCRCGRSENKPFCDGTHATAKWRDGLLTGSKCRKQY